MSLLSRLATVALVSLHFCVGCAVQPVDEVRDEGTGVAADALGTKHHYSPKVSGVSFQVGCGLAEQRECTYGFVLDYQPSYVDLTTTVTHSVNNTNHTLHITVDTWSYSTIHPALEPEAETYGVGLASAKLGHEYTVTVVDHNSKVLWTGKVTPLYHL
jgi:hypothetical protein